VVDDDLGALAGLLPGELLPGELLPGELLLGLEPPVVDELQAPRSTAMAAARAGTVERRRRVTPHYSHNSPSGNTRGRLRSIV
jgi:hypothetical protein